MTWTGVTNTPTLAGPNDHLLQIYGSLTLAAGTNLSFAGDVDFEAISTGKTISMYGKSFHKDATFNGVGGEWTLLDNFTTDQLIYLLRGTLNTNDKAVNAAAFYSYNYGAQRTLNMGASVFTLTNSGNMGFGNGLSDFWRVADPGAGLTINCGTSTINSTGSFLHTEFQSEGFTYYDVNFQGSGANMINQRIFGGPNTFHDVSFNAFADLQYPATYHDATFNDDAQLYTDNTFHDLNFVSNHTYVLANGHTQTINNRWQIQGSCTSYIVLQSSTLGSYATVTKPAGTVLGYNIHITDIHCTGGAVFHAYNSVDLGGNSGWQFSALPPLFNPDIISGPAAVCPGATAVIYHTIPVQGAIYYQWTVPPGATIVSGQGDTVIVVNFGTATTGNIVVETFNGCNYGTISSVLTVVLGSIIPVVTIVADPDSPVCAGTAVTFTVTVVNAGTATVTYDFKVNGISIQNGSLNTYTNSTLVNNDVITCEISLSGNTCFASTTATSNPVSVTTNTAAAVSIDVSPGDEVCIGDAILFTATATNTGGGNVVYDFHINGVSIQNGNSNAFTTTNLSAGDVVNCMVSIAGNLCATGASNSIVMKDGCNHNCSLQIPNAFTPNGDGVNDKWIISNRECIKQVDVFVYNRYGTLIYKKDNYQDEWQGTYKSQPMPDGTYYYVIKATTSEGRMEVIKGNVTILR